MSVCSGVEAATIAWHPLGWEPAAFCEIEKFPSAVLKHHWPEVPNWHDMTKITKEMTNERGPINLLVGGTPCQSFSIAGFRKGLEDPRGNLALEFLRIASFAGPGGTPIRWLLWENVTGALSSNEGRDFGSFLWGLVELGYGFSYRVLDSKFYGVPQTRRRVFLVAHFGDWRPSASVLFERESLKEASNNSIQEWSRNSIQTWFDIGNSEGTRRNIQSGISIRNLTPLEYERAQGFPDNHTKIPYRGKPIRLCPDGPRYKAIGNSMAIPVMRWLGGRFDNLAKTMA